MTIQAIPISSTPETVEYFVSYQEAKDQLLLPSITPRLRQCVVSVNDRISRATGYVPGGSEVTEHLDGGGCYLFLTYRPLVSVASVYDVQAQTTLATTDYEIRGAEQDCLYLLGANQRWASGQLRWRVTYVAGTDTPPAVLRSIGLAMVDREYSIGQEGARPPMSQAEIDDLLRDYYRIG